MPIGYSIHIGVNHVDPKHYGSDKRLSGCVNDARAMQKLAVVQGFTSTLLIDEDATVDAVLGALDDAAAAIGGDGIVMLTYSGHGDVVGDVSGDEPDGIDERWCLFDQELLDDRLFSAWGNFAEGARILVISDSCNAGGILSQLAEMKAAARSRTLLARTRATSPGGVRSLAFTQLANIGASVLLLGASSDNDTAKDGKENGAYTKALLKVWNKGRFQGNYVQLHDAIFAALRPQQLPVIRPLLPPSFMHQRPFTIDPQPPVHVEATWRELRRRPALSRWPR